MLLIAELKRRNVLRVGAAYVVTAWLIIQVVETILPAFGFGDGAIRIVTIVLAVGFIPTLVFAWAFELTPEGIRKESDVDRSQTGSARTGKRLDRMIMVVLALALAYFAVDKFVFAPQRQAQELDSARKEGRAAQLRDRFGDRSIAVLPFVNMSDDKDNEYFADGITEDILTLLGKVSGLRVPSRSSAFRFKNQVVDIASIAAQLNVNFILEGTVRKTTNRVRITAQLVEASTNSNLWSETFDRTFDDVLEVQDEITVNVVERLKLELKVEPPKADKVDPEAYALFLQARYLNRQASLEHWDEAMKVINQALEIDPDYAGAWDEMGSNYLRRATAGVLPAEEAVRLAEDAINKALSIDARYAMAHAKLGWIATNIRNDLVAAAEHFKRALELEPTNLRVIGNASFLLSRLGRWEEYIATTEYILSRDPMDHVAHQVLADALFGERRWEEAIEHADAALRLSPGRPTMNYVRGMSMLFLGKPESAQTAISAELREDYRLAGTASVFHAQGRVDEAREIVLAVAERDPTDTSLIITAALAYCNEVDLALGRLEAIVNKGEKLDKSIASDPRFDKLHGDPRWSEILIASSSLPEGNTEVKFEIPLPDHSAFLPDFSGATGTSL